MIKQLLCLIFLAPSLACATLGDFVREGNTLHFNGDINAENGKIVRQYLHEGVSTLIVNSNGGDIKEGLAIAQEMLKIKVNLVVEKYCYSACANYLFLAASTKSLAPQAVLGFHGGLQGNNPFSKSSKSKSPAIRKMMREMYFLWQSDELFFKTIGVDRSLIRKSFELTKVAKSRTSYTVTAGENIYTFTEEQSKKAFEFLEELKLKGVNAELQISLPSQQSQTKIYFPSERTLLKYGVKGLAECPYPANKEQMDFLAKEEGVDMIFVGDFSPYEAQITTN